MLATIVHELLQVNGANKIKSKEQTDTRSIHKTTGVIDLTLVDVCAVLVLAGAGDELRSIEHVGSSGVAMLYE